LIAGTLLGAGVGYISSQQGEAILVQTAVGGGVGMAAGLVAELVYLRKAAALDLLLMAVIALIVLVLCCAPRKAPYRSGLSPAGEARGLCP
jgi:hypothetical protein